MSFLTFCKFLIGSSENLTFKQHLSIIHSKTGSGIQPIGYIISQSYIEHITALFIGSHITIGRPIRVLRSINRICYRPILLRNLTSVIVGFKCFNRFKTLTTREQISSHHRIPILALRNHISIFLLHIRCSKIKLQLIIQEGSGVANGKVQTVISVIRHDTFRIGRRNRSECLVLFCTRSQCQ